MTANAKNGVMICIINLVVLLKLKTVNAPVQRPIIKLPQYKDIKCEILVWSIPFISGICKSAPKLLCMVTSTPTYTKIATMPSVSCGYFKAPKSLSNFSEELTVGNLENHKIVAHNINKPNKISAGILTALKPLDATTGPLILPNSA